jgi:hypothetical protein
MPASGTAKCDTCNYDVEVLEGWDGVEGLYHAGVGIPLPVRAKWIWCQQCGVSQSENLPLRSELEKELWRTRWSFRNWGKAEWQFTRQLTETETPVRSIHRKVLLGLLDLLAQRCSSPRCLRCGSADFQEFEGDHIYEGNGSIPHKDCGGTITLELGAIWTGILEAYPAYNSEGVRISWFQRHEEQWRLEYAIDEKIDNTPSSTDA